MWNNRLQENSKFKFVTKDLLEHGFETEEPHIDQLEHQEEPPGESGTASTEGKHENRENVSEKDLSRLGFTMMNWKRSRGSTLFLSLKCYSWL